MIVFENLSEELLKDVILLAMHNHYGHDGLPAHVEGMPVCFRCNGERALEELLARVHTHP